MTLERGKELFFLRSTRCKVRMEVFGGRHGVLVGNLFCSFDHDCRLPNYNLMNLGRATYARFSSSRVACRSGRSIDGFVKVSLSRS